MTERDSPEQTMRGQYAGFVSRFIAYAIDLAIVVVAQFTILFGIQVALSLFGLTNIVDQAFSSADATTIWGTVLRWVVLFVGGLAFFGVYLVFCWSVFDKTIGQALLGLLVVRTDGGHITLWVAVKRAIGYYISFVALLVGYLWVLIDDRRQGWHDKLAGTLVIYDWDARLGRRLLQIEAQQATQLDETGDQQITDIDAEKVTTGPTPASSYITDRN